MQPRKKRRDKVEPALSDPLSQKIVAMELRALDLRVEYRRTCTALQNLIDQRTVRQVMIESINDGINEAIAEEAN